MDLALVLAVLYFSLAGAVVGSLSGLAPGIHINTLALVLVSASPTLLPFLDQVAAAIGTPPGSAPLLLVSLIVSAAVAHSFLDALPSIFLGAPEEGTALHVLPGHRLLLEGRGLDAVACSAYGSLVGAAAAVTLCLPLSMMLGPPLNLHPLLDQATPFLVLLALAALVLSEKGSGMRAWIRARRIEAVEGVVSLVRPVPVDGSEEVLIGRLEEDRAGRRWLHTPGGRWRVRGKGGEKGQVRVDGTWMVRRDALPKRALAIVLLALSGLLGLTCMEARLPLSDVWEGMDHSILFPLLTGLFGLPALIGSARSGPIPTQSSSPSFQGELRPGLRGALSGALVGWFPGISSTTGIILASSLSRDGGERSDPSRYLTMASAVGTSSTVLGLLALSIAYTGRSGAMLAAKEVLGPDGAGLLTPPSPWFPLLLISTLAASALGYVLALGLGRRMARLAGGADLRRTNRAVLTLVLALVTAFCGLPGLIVLGAATLLGSLPPKLEVSRVHLTGCLLVPAALHFLGLKASLLAML